MNETRRNIIIKEIKYWKHSKLIPETYCDFLLALYTEGDVERFGDEKRRLIRISFMLLLALGSIFLFLFIYFTNSFLAMQIIAGMFSIGALIFIARKSSADNKLIAYFLSFLAALLFYLLTIKVINVVFLANTTYIVIVTLFHCLIWLWIGIKWRIHFFTFAALIGFLVLFVII